MSLWKVDIQKVIGTEYWTNVYHVEADNLADAKTIGDQIVVLEKAGHTENVQFNRMRVSDVAPDTDAYVTVPLTGQGSLANAGEILPLWNVVRVDFFTTVGRPSRKFLRGIVQEGYSNGTVITGGLRDTIQNQYATPLANLLGVVDVDGQPIEGGQVFATIGMRQLRRGSKRRLNPIIPPP